MNFPRLFRFPSFIAAIAILLVSSLFAQSPTPAKRGGSIERSQPTPRLPAAPTSAKQATQTGGSQVATKAPTPATRPTSDDNSNKAAESKSKTTLVSKSKSSDSKEPTDTNRYKLRYRMTPNMKIASEVTHLAKTNTKINDVAQSSQSRTLSRKVWFVSDVAKNGDMTFVHQVDFVEMSQQIGDGEELRYNSETDKEPIAIFQKVAETIGKPIATITINSFGQVVERSDEATGSNLGMGDITIPLPEEEIEVGTQWETPREIRVRRTDGTPKSVKVRELYTLEKVSAGVAVISIRSELLTPLTEPEVEAQAVQQMSNGTIRFDLDAGRLISKKLTWDKTIVGFSGAGSIMDYSARLEEVVQ